MENDKKVEMFTDGSCLGNPGPGGWCVLLRSAEGEELVAGGEAHTTNNRMELMAAVRGLEALETPLQSVAHHRFALCARRHQSVAEKLDVQRLEHSEQEASEE